MSTFERKTNSLMHTHIFLDHIFQCQYSSTDEKQRAPTAKADKGFFGSSGKLIMECTMDRDIFYHGQELPIHVVINNNSRKSVKSIRVSIGRLLHMYTYDFDLNLPFGKELMIIQ